MDDEKRIVRPPMERPNSFSPKEEPPLEDGSSRDDLPEEDTAEVYLHFGSNSSPVTVTIGNK